MFATRRDEKRSLKICHFSCHPPVTTVLSTTSWLWEGIFSPCVVGEYCHGTHQRVSDVWRGPRDWKRGCLRFSFFSRFIFQEFYFTLSFCNFDLVIQTWIQILCVLTKVNNTFYSEKGFALLHTSPYLSLYLSLSLSVCTSESSRQKEARKKVNKKKNQKTSCILICSLRSIDLSWNVKCPTPIKSSTFHNFTCYLLFKSRLAPHL